MKFYAHNCESPEAKIFLSDLLFTSRKKEKCCFCKSDFVEFNFAKDEGQVADLYLQGRGANHISNCKQCSKDWNTLMAYLTKISKHYGDDVLK